MLKVVEKDMPKSKRFTSEVLVISPEIAQAWLDQNTKNRKPSASVVAAYARDMKTKRWKLTGDAIRFDAVGNLIDGQHRLMACIAANNPFESLVVYGLDPTTQEHIDTGKVRRLTDMLTLRGVNNTLALAATIRVLFGQKYGDEKRQIKMTHAEGFALMEKHPQLHASVRTCMGAIGPSKSLLAYVHYVGAFKLDMKDRADAFIEVFKTGKPDYAGDPAHKLRERMLRARTERNEIKRDEIIKAVFHVWNLFAKKKKVETLKWPKEAVIEGFDPAKQL